MIRSIAAAGGLVARSIAAVVGTRVCTCIPWGSTTRSWVLMALQNPPVFGVLTYGYAALWFATAFFAASLALSVLAIVAPARPTACVHGHCQRRRYRQDVRVHVSLCRSVPEVKGQRSGPDAKVVARPSCVEESSCVSPSTPSATMTSTWTLGGPSTGSTSTGGGRSFVRARCSSWYHA
jgi:hypothetical protein